MKLYESESVNNMSTLSSKPRFGVPVCNGAEYGDEWNAINISLLLLIRIEKDEADIFFSRE